MYLLGLTLQSHRGSSSIWGVRRDAKYLAEQIAIQRSYLAREDDQPWTQARCPAGPARMPSM